MKKLIVSALMTALLFQYPVLAENNGELNIYTLKNENTISKIETSVDGSCIAAVFLNDKTLYTVSPVILSNGTANVNIPCPNEEYTFKLYYEIGSDKYLSVGSDNVKYLPDNFTADNNEQNSENTSDNSNQNTGFYPSVYGTPAVALGAFAVIKSVEKAVSYDDDIITKLLVYYMGSEMYLELSDDFLVENKWKYSDVADVSQLTEGDIITFSSNLSGKILKVSLIFRNFDRDLTDDEEGLTILNNAKNDISDKSIVYGVITNKLKNNTLVISDGTGLDKNAQYLGLDPETVVYYYDSSNRNNKLKISSVAEIENSEIAAADKDDNDNIISWDKDALHNFAFARVHDGVICDIVIYANY